MSQRAWPLFSLLPAIFILLCHCSSDPSDGGADSGTDIGNNADMAGPDATDTGSGADAVTPDAGETGDTAVEVLEIVGDWSDDLGYTYTITSDTWIQVVAGYTSQFNILSFSNEDDYLIAQNADTNDWFANLFSRFDWTWVSGELWVCQSSFDAATEGDAEAASADDSDPENAGCGGFPWSHLVEAE